MFIYLNTVSLLLYTMQSYHITISINITFTNQRVQMIFIKGPKNAFCCHKVQYDISTLSNMNK